MRRLPVFFVLDCSESMVGDNLKKMENGVTSIVQELRKDPHALEAVYFSIIPFAGISKTLSPLVEIVSFYPPKLPLGGGTSLGAAIEILMTEIDKNVIKTTADRKGDWKPIVYLWTDGRPTDNPDIAISKWHSKYAKHATLIAIGIGKNADLTVLRRLTEHVILFEDHKEGDYKKFINWVTASVVAQSKSVGESADANVLPILDESVMRLITEAPSKIVDETSVTLIGRCQKTHKPYILKYEREMQDVTTRDMKLQVTHYEIAGCYPLDEDYFAWSDPLRIDQKVHTSELLGSAGCPHCGARSAFGVCECGKLMCISGPGNVVCPWCENKVSFTASDTSDSEGFDVGRGRG